MTSGRNSHALADDVSLFLTKHGNRPSMGVYLTNTMKLKNLLSVLVFAASLIPAHADTVNLNNIDAEWDKYRINQGLDQLNPAWNGIAFGLYDSATKTILPPTTFLPATTDAANAVTRGSNTIVFEGATANAFETTLTAVDPTADQTISLPNVGANSALMFSTLTTNTVDAANSIWFASNSLVLEGATANGFEMTISPADVTADRTITIPDASGTVRVAQASTAVALAADNQAVTPGTANVIQLSSDNATATNRTFTLSATGAITGAIYILIGPATNQCELADTGIQVLSATWSPTVGDSLTLLFDGTNFTELARADN